MHKKEEKEVNIFSNSERQVKESMNNKDVQKGTSQNNTIKFGTA